MRDTKLTDEHIVPYSLGGSHVIRKASCLECADITKRFEQRVARDLWGDARIASNSPSRRKRERSSLIEIPDKDHPARNWSVPASEYPTVFVFYKMDKAGLLFGLPEDVDLSSKWNLIAVNDEAKVKTFHEKYPGKLVGKFRHVPDAFARMLAKIGYGHTLTLLDVSDFRPICLPYILGEKPNLSYIVGGSTSDQIPDPRTGYSLNTGVIGHSKHLLIIAVIRLYANTHAPAYHVIVGDVVDPDKIQTVFSKLRMDESSLSQISTEKSEDQHWTPKVWPLPFLATAQTP